MRNRRQREAVSKGAPEPCSLEISGKVRYTGIGSSEPQRWDMVTPTRLSNLGKTESWNTSMIMPQRDSAWSRAKGNMVGVLQLHLILQ